MIDAKLLVHRGSFTVAGNTGTLLTRELALAAIGSASASFWQVLRQHLRQTIEKNGGLFVDHLALMRFLSFVLNPTLLLMFLDGRFWLHLTLFERTGDLLATDLTVDYNLVARDSCDSPFEGRTGHLGYNIVAHFKVVACCLRIVDAGHDAVVPILAALVALRGLEVGRHQAVFARTAVWALWFRSTCELNRTQIINHALDGVLPAHLVHSAHRTQDFFRNLLTSHVLLRLVVETESVGVAIGRETVVLETVVAHVEDVVTDGSIVRTVHRSVLVQDRLDHVQHQHRLVAS